MSAEVQMPMLEREPFSWLFSELPKLPLAKSPIEKIQQLCSAVLLAVINLSLRPLCASMTLREDAVRVANASVSDIVQVTLGEKEDQQEDQESERYDYLIIYLKDIFATLVCAHHIAKLSQAALIQLGCDLVSEAVNFLGKRGEIVKDWKLMNQHAMGFVVPYFSRRDNLLRMFKLIFPYLQPYLAMNPSTKKPVTILTKAPGECDLWNIPIAVESNEPPVFEARASVLEQVLSNVDEELSSFMNFPINSQAADCCRIEGFPLVRNARLEIQQGKPGEPDKCYMQMATPVLPTHFWKAMLRIFFGYRPRNSEALRLLCERYIEAAKTMFDRALEKFFPKLELGFSYVYLHLVTDIFPPEPDAIDLMGELEIYNWRYANTPFKDFEDYGVSRVDFSLNQPVFLVLSEIGGVEFGAFFSRLVRNIDLFQVQKNHKKQKANQAQMKKDLGFLLEKSVIIDPQNPIPALMAWFYILLLEHRYAEMRRVSLSPIWQACLANSVQNLQKDKRGVFKKRWNIFVHMNPQIGVVSALLALIIENSPLFQSVEGCKSAKDRATEVMLFKVFIYSVLLGESDQQIDLKLRHCLVHSLVFLKLYCHVPGTMNNGGYSDTKNVDTCPDAKNRLELLDGYMRQLRRNAARYRASIFSDQKPRRTQSSSSNSLSI
jgi:hypothetical protein